MLRNTRKEGDVIITDSQIQLLIDNKAAFGSENGVSAGERIAMNTEESRQFVSQFWQKDE